MTFSRLKTTLLLQACVTPLYALILLAGQRRNIGIDDLGLTFNSMLDHLLHGRWDVDPAVIGHEAFVHDGKTYAYFGPVPALLRLPIVLLPGWRNLHVELVYCLCAMLAGAGAQAYTLLTILRRNKRATCRALAPPLLSVSLLSGPAIMIAAKGPLIYHESILWAWAWAMLFVAVALDGLMRPLPLTCSRYSVLSLLAGLCLLTRVTTGAGLCVATTMLILRGFYLSMRRQAMPKSVIPNCLSVPTLLLVSFVLVAAAVNEERWNNPFVFADLHDQVFQIELHPERLQRLQHFGSFDLSRIGIGLLYYFAPVWDPLLDHSIPLGTFLYSRFDGLERPSSSLLITDPLWCIFAAYGAFFPRSERGYPWCRPPCRWALSRTRSYAGRLVSRLSLSCRICPHTFHSCLPWHRQMGGNPFRREAQSRGSGGDCREHRSADSHSHHIRRVFPHRVGPDSRLFNIDAFQARPRIALIDCSACSQLQQASGMALRTKSPDSRHVFPSRPANGNDRYGASSRLITGHYLSGTTSINIEYPGSVTLAAPALNFTPASLWMAARSAPL